jgi:hypothetical protein
MASIEADGGSPKDDAPARPPKEPSDKESLMERIASVSRALDEEPAASPGVSHGQASGLESEDAGLAAAATAQSATRFSSDPESTLRVVDGKPQIAAPEKRAEKAEIIASRYLADVKTLFAVELAQLRQQQDAAAIDIEELRRQATAAEAAHAGKIAELESILARMLENLEDAPEVQSATRFSSDPESTSWVPDDGAQIADGLTSLLAKQQEPATKALPEQEAVAHTDWGPSRPSQPTPEHEAPAKRRLTFRNLAKAVKSRSTSEASEDSRKQEETTETPAENTLYMVCEVDLGACIYKVSEGKRALIGEQPGSYKSKFFADLEDAKVEAKAIFSRIAAARAAWGFLTSILDQPLQDLMKQEETNVPDFSI